MSTYRELLNTGKKHLERAGIDDWNTDAWLLLEYVSGMDRTRYFMEQDQIAAETEEERYLDFLKKRAARIPLQQLTHEAWFFGLPFYVNENVLIPRQDTEILVEEVLKEAKKNLPDRRSPLKILDMCTGSGCILLSLLANMENAAGTGADLSEKALEVARENGKRLKLKADWCFSDLFSHIEGKYDIIVSNPPYIASQVIGTLMEEVRDHEPRMALDGKEDGLYFYRRLTKENDRYLKSGGLLAFEIGYDQGKAVRTMMQEALFEDVKVIKDLAGLDRVVTGRKKQEDTHV